MAAQPAAATTRRPTRPRLHASRTFSSAPWQHSRRFYPASLGAESLLTVGIRGGSQQVECRSSARSAGGARAAFAQPPPPFAPPLRVLALFQTATIPLLLDHLSPLLSLVGGVV